MMSGLPSGLRVRDWKIAPPIPRDAPSRTATSARGSRPLPDDQDVAGVPSPQERADDAAGGDGDLTGPDGYDEHEGSRQENHERDNRLANRQVQDTPEAGGDGDHPGPPCLRCPRGGCVGCRCGHRPDTARVRTMAISTGAPRNAVTTPTGMPPGVATRARTSAPRIRQGPASAESPRIHPWWGPHDPPDDVRHHEADESDGTGDRRGSTAGRGDAQDPQEARPQERDAERGGEIISQGDGAEVARCGGGGKQPDRDEREGLQRRPYTPHGEGAGAPGAHRIERSDIQQRDRRGQARHDRGESHAGQGQSDGVGAPAAGRPDGKDSHRRDERPDHGAPQLALHPADTEQGHAGSNRYRGSGVDPEDAGIGQWVTCEGLDEGSGNRDRGPHRDPGNRAWNPGAPHHLMIDHGHVRG